MFRITIDKTEDAKLVEYLEEITSRTILEAFEFTFCTNGEREMFYENNYYGFFSGMGRCFDGTDDAFGREWLERKIESIKKKLADPEEAYTFDVFEENVFYNVCTWIESCRESGVKDPICTIHRKQEASIRQTLMDEFGCKEKLARYYASAVCRCWQMTLREYEDDNLFFWDDDYLFFFENGFIDGIKRLKAFVGENAGYGYDYVVNMFEEIGAKVPLLLLGTKEANRIANELTLEAFKEKQEKFFQDLPGVASSKHVPVDEADLPFGQ